MIPSLPFTFRNCRILTLVYRTDRSAIESLLPEPLVATGDEVMIHPFQMSLLQSSRGERVCRLI